MTDTQESVFPNQTNNDQRFGFLSSIGNVRGGIITALVVLGAVLYHQVLNSQLEARFERMEKTLDKKEQDVKASIMEVIQKFETKMVENFDVLKGLLGRELEATPKSCKEIVDNQRSDGNKAYTLDVGGKKMPVYCQVTPLEGCGGGGWTMVMKIDGTKQHFIYDSALWTDLITFNTPGGETGFDAHETKLPTYWQTPFSRICVGMKVGLKAVKFQVIDKEATSLYSLIADDEYRATSLGRKAWKDLLGTGASLQDNCNREGFNAKADQDDFSKARIGITSNNEDDCNSNDSRIGFGTSGYPDDKQSCGNIARNGADNRDRTIPAMGYILVQ